MNLPKNLLLLIKRNFPRYPSQDQLNYLTLKYNLSPSLLRNAFKWLRENERLIENNSRFRNGGCENDWESYCENDGGWKYPNILKGSRKRVLKGKWISSPSEIHLKVIQDYVRTKFPTQLQEDVSSTSQKSIPKDDIDKLQEATHLPRRQISFMIHYYRCRSLNRKILNEHWDIVKAFLTKYKISTNDTIPTPGIIAKSQLSENYLPSKSMPKGYKFMESDTATMLTSFIDEIQTTNTSQFFNTQFLHDIIKKCSKKELISKLQKETGLSVFQLRYMIRVLRDRDGYLTPTKRNAILNYFDQRDGKKAPSEADYSLLQRKFELSRRQIKYLEKKWKDKKHILHSITKELRKRIEEEFLSNRLDIQSLQQSTPLTLAQIQSVVNSVKRRHRLSREIDFKAKQIVDSTQTNDEMESLECSIATGKVSYKKDEDQEILPPMKISPEPRKREIYAKIRDFLEENDYCMDNFKTFTTNENIPYNNARRIARNMISKAYIES